MAHFKNTAFWVHGLVSAFIGGAVTVCADIGADAILEGEVVLNFKKLGLKALVMGIIMAGIYLKQSPLPQLEETVFIEKKKE